MKLFIMKILLFLGLNNNKNKSTETLEEVKQDKRGQIISIIKNDRR